jgi:hypothetical protein
MKTENKKTHEIIIAWQEDKLEGAFSLCKRFHAISPEAWEEAISILVGKPVSVFTTGGYEVRDAEHMTDGTFVID